VLAAQATPLVALVLFGGVFADRLPRQLLIVASDIVRAVLQSVLALLILTGEARIWELIVIEVFYGAAMAFFQPAYVGLLPQTVPEDEIQSAKALAESVQNAAMMLGPALGTALVLGIGAGEAFALDAVSFVFSAWTAIRIRPRQRGDAAVFEQSSVLHELRAGFHEVRSREWVWVVIGCFTVAVLAGFATWYSLAPSIARRYYGGAAVFGLLETMIGAGAVVGAVVGIRWRPRRPVYAGMLLGLVWPLQGIAFALGAPEAFVVPLSAATGFGFTLLMIWWETALANHIPPAALSRVSAWDWMGSLALLPIGYALAGPLASAFGARATLGVGSLIAFGALAIALTSRSLRALTDTDSDLALAEQAAGELHVAVGGEPEVAQVDALV
jgi:predicted MFS family arabinose efflux permease